MKQVDRLTTPPGGYRYTQPETGAPFNRMTWQALIAEVAEHRKGEGLDLSVGWESRVEEEACTQNGWNCVDADPREDVYGDLQRRGHALWVELHAYTHQYPENPSEGSKSEARAWLADFANRIPRYGCKCSEDWARLTSSFPANLTDRQSFVRWAEISHDWVNRRIGKPFWNEAQYKASPAVSI